MTELMIAKSVIEQFKKQQINLTQKAMKTSCKHFGLHSLDLV